MRTALLILLLACVPHVRAAEAPGDEAAITLPSGVEVVSRRFAAAHGPLLLWFTGQYGPVEAERRAASSLAGKGVEVWLTDWLAPYFLPQLPGSVAQVPDRDLGDWLAAIQGRQPGRPILLAASGHTADLALRAARDARDRQGVTPLGSVLLFPLLYRGLEPGAEPDYAPVVDATRQRLAVLVPKSSAGYWWRDRFKQRLEEAGSWVKLTVLPGMRDGFYRRTDATEAEMAAGATLGDTLWQLLQDVLAEKAP
jgi:hypothetical protein